MTATRRPLEAADRIAAEERRMMEPLESTFDRAVDASLRALGRDDLTEQLPKYLAHSNTPRSAAATFPAPQARRHEPTRSPEEHDGQPDRHERDDDDERRRQEHREDCLCKPAAA
jgi:hypothetical protein